MMRRIAVKLSIILSIVLLVIITFVLLATDYWLNTFFVDYITEELLHRGQGYAEVLSQEHHGQGASISDEHYMETLAHVSSMEKATLTDVIVVDDQMNIIASSKQMTEEYLHYLDEHYSDNMYQHTVLETNWEEKSFLVTRSPIITEGEYRGAVYMYTPTKPIRDAISVQTKALIGIWVVGLFLGMCFIYIISRLVTKPVLAMKHATERISKGDYDVEIQANSNDELGDLGQAISGLAKSLDYYERNRHDFLADIAHELRTPLTYLKGYSELLAKGDIEDQREIQQFHQIIYEQAQRLQRLVQDITTLNAMDQTHFSLLKRPVNIVTLVQKSMDVMRLLYEQKNVRLSFDYDSNMQQEIQIDGERFTQVLLNLLDNALRYTPDGGTVAIEVAEVQQGVRIIVRDTGTGIDEQELPFIWERLHRSDKSRSRDTGGSGLGLAIVKKIIDLHAGEIVVDSQAGQGTQFTIQLPF